MRVVWRSLFVLSSLLPLACSGAEEDKAAWVKAGEHYKVVRTQQPPADPAKIDVQEIFWYGCSHCYKFDPFVERWRARKPPDVVFTRVPATLGRPDGIAHAKVFYAADTLGVLGKFHGALFAAIHDGHKTMATEEAVAPAFEQATGIKADDFKNAFNSFAVDAQLRRSEALVRDYGIASVPSVVVGGKYFTNGTLAGGSYDKVLEVIDVLVAKVRREQGKS